jgi:hypothetical protein
MVIIYCGLLPGCLIGPAGRSKSGQAQDAAKIRTTGSSDATASSWLDKPRVQSLKDETGLAILAPPVSSYNPFPESYLHSVFGTRLASGLKGVDPAGTEESSHQEDVWPPPLPFPPSLPRSDVFYPTAPQPGAEKKEPLLEALECFLKDKPKQALDLLRNYQPSSQEVYIALLPVLAQLTHKGLDQLSPEEVSAIHEQLRGLSLTLRPRASLKIDRMCFCEEIHGYGVYKALPPGHSFRPRIGDHEGELVRLYVEVRNFSLQPCPEGYLTRLSTSVEIRNDQDKPLWFHSFQAQEDKEGPQYRQTPWSDCFGNYRFFVPPLPPGTHTLTITIRDLTRPEARPPAQKSLQMRVAM